jgi:hypothetical protein
VAWLLDEVNGLLGGRQKSSVDWSCSRRSCPPWLLAAELLAFVGERVGAVVGRVESVALLHEQEYE